MEIEFEGSKLFYHKAGEGKKNILFFHGFGQDHRIFLPVIDVLRHDYTCYSFDLFFHGQSVWAKGDTPIQKQEWNRLIDLFLNRESIQKFTVVGYSLGGRLAFTTLELYPTHIEKIILVAAEGLRKNMWYSIATSSPGKNIFRSFINHPNRFTSLLKMSQYLRLVPKGLVRFVSHQMNTDDKRTRVYFSWLVFSHLNFSISDVASLIRHYAIQSIFVFGKTDHIMKMNEAARIKEHIAEADIQLIDAGHYELIKHLPSHISEWVNPHSSGEA